MLAEIGFIATLLAFLTAIYATIAGIVGGRRHDERIILSARNAALATFPLLLVAAGMLLIGLMTEQYQISYVWMTTEPSTPAFYRFTALWGSQQGSILFWSLLMSAFMAGALVLNWRSHYRLMPYATAFMAATVAFFVGINLTLENPFDRYWVWEGRDVIVSNYDEISPALIDDALVTAGLNGQANNTQELVLRCATAEDAERAQIALTTNGAQVVLQPQVCTTQGVFQPANTFEPDPLRLAETANGLNPLLRHFGMIIHPPMLYLGFVGFIIPFAFAMAALASGELSSNWIKATRRWTLVAWVFLSLGLILGGRWAYDVLGWGGYWGWDPVENAAFLPWLVGTAFLHSVMIQEKRGMLKVWNMFLVIGAFSAVLFGTFATRSGLIDSVHSFARSEIGFPMLLFWSGMSIIGVALILWRWNHGELRDEHTFGGLLSRESLFVLNNIVFVALTVAIFWGSFGAPIISELFLDTEITIGLDYYYQVTPPLFLAMYILMGIAPLSAWGATSLRRLGRALTIPFVLTVVLVIGLIALGTPFTIAVLGYGIVCFAGFVALYEIYRGIKARRQHLGENPLQALMALFQRNRRRYGGYIIHLGVVVIGIGVIGSTLFQSETQRTLGIGEQLTLGEYALRLDNIDAGLIAADGRLIDAADLTVFRNGGVITTIRPRIDRFFQNNGQVMPMTIAGQYSTLENDIYALLLDYDEPAQTVTVKLYINPLVNLVWYGGLILVLGTLIAAWPREPEPVHLRERRVIKATT